MADTETEAPEHRDPGPPPAVPWIQALGIVATVVVVAIDAWGPDDFAPPWQLYLLFAAAIIGLDPETAIRMVTAWRK